MTKVDLITGFLGAGKTTFLSRYGAWLNGQGCRFAVIENEFGAGSVDQTILGEEFDHVSELSGGCICCTLKAGFHNALARLAGNYDRILVEPSGLFDMDEFFEVLDVLERDGLCEPGMCLTLIDPHCLPGLTSAEQTVLRTELTGTGAVLWTHADIAPVPEEASSIEQVLALLDLEETLAFYPVPAHQLTDADFAAMQRICPVRRAHRRTPVNHQMLFQSTLLRLQGIFDPQQLHNTLVELVRTEAHGKILRVKGFVNAEDGSLEVNLTSSGCSVTPCAKKRSMLNIIGHELDRAGLKAGLQNIAYEGLAP